MSKPELTVEHIEDIIALMDAARRHPSVVVHIRRELFDTVISVLRKEMITVSIRNMDRNIITAEVSYPENMVRIHRDILYKSHKLAYPDVLLYFIKISSYIKHTVCKTPYDLSKSLTGECVHGYRFIIFYPRSRLGRGYIVCGGSTGEILAAIYEEAITYLGVEAIRFMFFRLPATLFIYVVNR